MVCTEELDYTPVSFLRCHSRNKDPADVQTQVWNCSFEPSPHHPDQSTSIVATCGGNSICFIDCTNGKVLNKYYSPSIQDNLFSLAWTTITYDDRNLNVLAAGGSNSVIHVIQRAQNQCIVQHSLKTKKTVFISAVLFHPEHREILYCGTSDGTVRILELVYSSDESTLKLLSQIENGSEIFSFAFCKETGHLLASCDGGLFAFAAQKRKNQHSLSPGVLIELPAGPSKLVDSVESLGDGRIAAKAALHGNIYIIKLPSYKLTKSSVKIIPERTLTWSKTDNYFMYMGHSSNLLACGDDEGAIWMYDLTEETTSPTCIIQWPSLEDRYGDKKRKLNLTVYDIVVDKVAVHSTGEYVVAVTNNNMVCIWKRKCTIQ